MITYGRLKQHILLAIGGQPSIVSGVSRDQRLAEAVNQAGTYMFSRQWRFRERASRPVGTVAAQEWAALPDNVEEIISLVATVGYGARVELVSPEQIELLRQSISPTIFGSVLYAALVRPWAQSNGTTPIPAGDPFPAVRLDLYPTPQATVPNAMTIRYRAGWEPVSGDQNAMTPDTFEIAVPPYAEALLIAYCRAFATSYEDEGLSARLVEIDNGPIWNAAATKDGLIQRDYGRLNTEVVRPFVHGPSRYRRGYVPFP